MPDFICENCGRREFHENEDTLKMMIKDTRRVLPQEGRTGSELYAP